MISVIVPVYNVEKYLRACVDSILASTYKDFEVILVDDESTDQSGQICDSYQAKDERIRVIHNEKKYRGPSEARNLGIKEAKGEYLAFIDSDDEIHPSYLETLICGIESNSADVSMVNNWWKIKDKPDDDTHKSETWVTVDGYNAELALLYQEKEKELIPIKNLTPPWGKLFRKTVFDDIEFPVDLYYEDEYIVHRWLYQSKRLCYCNQKLYYYYDRTDGITGAHNDKRIVDTVGALLDRARMFTEKKVGQEICYKAVHSWMWFLIKHYSELTTQESRNLYLKSARKNKDLIQLLCNSKYYSIYYHLWLINPRLAEILNKFWKTIR